MPSYFDDLISLTGIKVVFLLTKTGELKDQQGASPYSQEDLENLFKEVVTVIEILEYIDEFPSFFHLYFDKDQFLGLILEDFLIISLASFQVDLSMVKIAMGIAASFIKRDKKLIKEITKGAKKEEFLKGKENFPESYQTFLNKIK